VRRWRLQKNRAAEFSQVSVVGRVGEQDDPVCIENHVGVFIAICIKESRMERMTPIYVLNGTGRETMPSLPNPAQDIELNDDPAPETTRMEHNIMHESARGISAAASASRKVQTTIKSLPSPTEKPIAKSVPEKVAPAKKIVAISATKKSAAKMQSSSGAKSGGKVVAKAATGKRTSKSTKRGNTVAAPKAAKKTEVKKVAAKKPAAKKAAPKPAAKKAVAKAPAKKAVAKKAVAKKPVAKKAAPAKKAVAKKAAPVKKAAPAKKAVAKKAPAKKAVAKKPAAK
jgi:histone H1/5